VCSNQVASTAIEALIETLSPGLFSRRSPPEVDPQRPDLHRVATARGAGEYESSLSWKIASKRISSSFVS